MAFRLSSKLKEMVQGIRTNLITNPSFDSSATGWTAVASTLASVSGGLAGNCLQITLSGGADGSAYQDIATIPGKIYAVTVAFKKGTASGGKLYIGSSSDRAALYSGPLLTNTAWPATAGTDANAPAPNAVFVATDTATRITLECVDTTSGRTALFDSVLACNIDTAFRSAMKGCYFTFFTSSQPANADLAATGTSLVTFTNGGDGVNGLNWGDSVAGVISKDPGQTWQGLSTAVGTAGWFRCWVAGDDPTAAATIYPRFDGSIGTTGAEITVSNAAIDAGAVQTITGFSVTF